MSSISGSDPPDAYVRRRVKAELRKRMRGVRKTAPLEACRERSAQIVKRIESLAVVKAARSAALFWPIEERHEVDLRALDASLRARRAKVCYPAIDPDNGVMTFRFVDDVTLLAEQGYGFREPPNDAKEARPGEVDIVVVPAIALDPAGHRIGYGAGYYDRTLPRFVPPGVSIGVAYDYQLIAEVPALESDIAVGWVVTDTRVIEVSV
jgi:5-formyltetrahydrofolate cyclo-ligase